ncbi:MAG: four helix bundle protein [Candidatus Woykebacteria bacterium RIFCSPLOWO2_01_FULL_41_12]|uniref:Four helix bundle protein n=1 Tax=Candidatus Woykebacteria bacterium RIFCSPLOWO2_01_FULL_41_12 TaxID=1802604 RepID=A0A1G1WUE6_9BACT|nr:MAG: four helix bundle protein [Candidatus Woykebacteria bacterium RIFCSPLOWO2_01_FULL_41_12]
MENRFEKLDVWQYSHDLVLKIYKITNKFPREEKFRLGDQLRRSASPIPTNIVEGNSRAHKKEFTQFLYLAKSSLDETKYHLLLAKDLGYITDKTYDSLQEDCNKIGKMLSGLIRHLRSGS